MAFYFIPFSVIYLFKIIELNAFYTFVSIFKNQSICVFLTGNLFTNNNEKSQWDDNKNDKKKKIKMKNANSLFHLNMFP